MVSAERPTSAKPGDSAVIDEDGTIVGFVGGSCVEDAARAGPPRHRDGRQRGAAHHARRTGGGRGDGLPGHVTAVNPCLSGGTLEIFLEPVLPAPLVGIFGEAPIARALAEVAAAAGYSVDVISGDKVPIDAVAVVVASHGRGEEDVLLAALDAGVPYVGLVASRRRGTSVVAALGEGGQRVRTPAGLDLGARTPGEVAVSILAQIIASRPRAEVAAPVVAPPRRADAVDPVCGMTVATVEASLHADHEGVYLLVLRPRLPCRLPRRPRGIQIAVGGRLGWFSVPNVASGDAECTEDANGTDQVGTRTTSTATSSSWSTAGPNTTPRTGATSP